MFLSVNGTAQSYGTAQSVPLRSITSLPETGQQQADTTLARACLTGEFAEITAARFRWAVHAGAGGWIDDDLAFTHDWAFDLAAISCPVLVWQGSHDLMVPPAHGEWLAAHVPRAVPMLFPEEGHLSLAVGRYREIVADVVARGTAPA